MRHRQAEHPAVFRLITGSNVVGRCTGKSAGLAPLRIFPTEAKRYAAAAEAALKTVTLPNLAIAHRNYVSALALAPWHAEWWRQLAMVDELLGSAGAAVAALQFYLLAEPDAPDRPGIERRLKYLQQASNQ